MGALTLKVFSNELREWELIEGEAIDPTDSFGTNLRVSIREDQIYLAEPNDVNVPWITDKGRLFFDGMFDKKAGYKPKWEPFFQEILDLMYFVDHLNFQRKNIFSLLFAFENLSVELLSILYLLEQNCSVVKLRKVENHKTQNDLELNYQLNDSVQKPKLYKSTLAMLVNTNPRHEGYVLNLNLRQRFLKGNFKVLSIGPMLDLTFPTYSLGSNLSILKSIGEGTHLTCQDFKNSEFPLLITNTELFKRDDAKLIFKVLKNAGVLKTAWVGFNVLNHNINSVGVSSFSKFLPLTNEDFTNFFGFYSVNVPLNSFATMKQLTELHLLNVFSTSNLGKRVFIDQNSKPLNKDIALSSTLYKDYFHLPSNLFLEDSETFVNTQGLVKRTTKLISFKKGAKSNWQIIRKLYANSKSLFFFNQKKDSTLISFDCVNSFNFKNYVSFNYYASQTLTSLSFYLVKQNSPILKSRALNFKESSVKVYNTKLKAWLDDFFTNSGKDVFSYNSSVLTNCSKIARSSSTNFF